MSDQFAPPPPAQESPVSPVPVTSADAVAGSSAQSRAGGRRRAGERGRAGAHEQVGTPRQGVALWVRWVLVAAAAAILAGLVWSVGLIIADAQAAPADPDATGDLHALQVVDGMCLEDLGADGPTGEASVVECRDPHRGEVIAAMTYPLEVYPGTAAIEQQALDYCTERVRGLVPASGSWIAWTPSEDSWVRGDRTALCIVTSPEPTTGSVVPSPPIEGETA
ncbi:septum formation family protein [Demequina sp. NBRC 110051]|uniref:septum formation family protein n=1 Tax=Demequina sp. NBRC 110051 TaxID=1570340 RepID=UPI001180D72F|nr:septum formation family protein [Demequina sp. NBRC 110051]